MNVYTNYQGGGRARECVFDYNSDGIADIICGCNSGWIYVFLGYDQQGIEEESGDPAGDLLLTLSGVPTSGPFSVTLVLPQEDVAEITVYDALGHAVILGEEYSSGTHFFNISDFPPGLYFVSAMTRDSVISERLIKLN
jgi:hypothetical protein